MHQRYDIFDLKKEEYEKKIFDIETSLQYIDDVKRNFIQNQKCLHLNEQLEQTKQLKNVQLSAK